MHHEVIGKPSKGLDTDHVDGNGLNNQKHNLRHVTRRQNGQNRHAVKTSRYPGVRWHKKSKKWIAEVRINGRGTHLGRFVSETEAFYFYCKAVNDLGEEMVDSQIINDNFIGNSSLDKKSTECSCQQGE
jgi:hypothetical protein